MPGPDWRTDPDGWIEWTRSRRIRYLAESIYGNKCVQCGSIEGLEFDHINGDGQEHRWYESGATMVERIARTGKRIEDYQIQLLCRPCHYAKTRAEIDAKWAQIRADGFRRVCDWRAWKASNAAS